MPLAKNASWGFVAETNRKEINTRVKWLCDNTPQEHEADVLKKVLDKPAAQPRSIPRHMLPEGAEVPDAPGPSSAGRSEPRAHRHRHHRKSCPRHAKRDQDRSVKATEQERVMVADASKAVEKGNAVAALELRRAADRNAAAPSESEKAAAKKPAMSRRDRELQAILDDAAPTLMLPKLHVPHTVGKGMAMFLTGTYVEDPHQFDRRPLREHPNFGAVARPFDPKVQQEFHATPTPEPGADPSKSAPLAHRKLLAIPVDKSRCRLKDEVKAHLELACTSAKTMMRGKR